MISRPLWASGLPSRDFRNPLVIAGADVRSCNRDTGRVHGPATAKTASLQAAAERFERADTLAIGACSDPECRRDDSHREGACAGPFGHRVPGTTRTV